LDEPQHHIEIGPPLENAEMAPQPPLRPQIVGIDEGQIFATRHFDPAIARRRRAGIGLLQDTQGGTPGLGDGQRFIGRSIVDH
jgi:hypothetical protein